MYCLGTTPPTILLPNSKPVPISAGANSITTWPYCPCPPVWRLNLLSIRAACRIVSRYGTRRGGLDRAELALEPIDDDVDMGVAHGRKDRLPGAVLTMDPDCRLLFTEPMQCRPSLSRSALDSGSMATGARAPETRSAAARPPSTGHRRGCRRRSPTPASRRPRCPRGRPWAGSRCPCPDAQQVADALLLAAVDVVEVARLASVPETTRK